MHWPSDHNLSPCATQTRRLGLSYTELQGEDHHGADYCIDSTQCVRSVTARTADEMNADFARIGDEKQHDE